MNHFELDNLVANLAKEAGAKIILKYNMIEVKTSYIENNLIELLAVMGQIPRSEKVWICLNLISG